MNTKSKERESDFQQRPDWIFITIVILLIEASPDFSDLILDFLPKLNRYWQGGLKSSFIIIGLVLFAWIYWWNELQRKKSYDPIKISEDEFIKRATKKAKWLTWKQNIFKYYPLNIITLKIIPLFICWIISKFINKEYKSYGFHFFDFPKDWEQYDYEEITSKFFKSMFRVWIEKLNKSYEIKFERDFQHIEIRWTDNNDSTFNEPKNELYEKIFSEDKFKHIELFTWIFPFGLYWNLIRVIKNLFSKNNNLIN